VTGQALASADTNNVEPLSYLTKVIEKLPYCVKTEDFEALLPT
jgi:hypothetical protein